MLRFTSDDTSQAYTICRHCFGRNWVLHVAPSSAWKVLLAVETLLLDAALQIDAMQTAWQGFEATFSLRPSVSLSPDLLFENHDFSITPAPAARAPRHYQRDPAMPCAITLTSAGKRLYTCELCAFASTDAAVFDVHLSAHFTAGEKRARILAQEAAAWPQPVARGHVKDSMRKYASAFWTRMQTTAECCACCARGHQHVSLDCYDLRTGSFSLIALHEYLSAHHYHRLHCQLYPVPLPADFQGLPQELVTAAGVRIPLEVNAEPSDAWLLHLSAAAITRWNEATSAPGEALECTLCHECAQALQLPVPRLPARALANGNLCLPLPPEFRDLSFAERLFIARGYTVKRMHTLPGRSSPADRQRGFSGNVVSFPQNSASIAQILPRHPDEAAELLTVFFQSEDQLNLHTKGPYLVRRAQVAAVLAWLRVHNPFYIDISIDAAHLAALPEHGVPSQFLLPGAVPSLAAEPGPADAQVQGPRAGLDETLPLAAAVLDSEGEAIHPVELWRHALHPGSSAATRADDYDVLVPHGQQPLSSFDLGYWVLCFPHLFPYGDGVAGGARRVSFFDKTWARHLLLRVDRSPDAFHWSLDIDFLAVLFSILHRKELLQAVHAKIHTPGFAHASRDFQRLLHTDFAAIYEILGDNGGLTEALRALLAI